MYHKLAFIAILFITAYIAVKNYWRIQLMYNSALLSCYTPSSFTIPEKYKSSHDNFTNLGTNIIKQKSVVLCTLLRDVAHKMPELIQRAEKIGGLFGSYHVLVVENNSSDGTRKKLIEWKNKNPKIIILGCGVNVPEECSLDFAKVKTEGHSVDINRINKMSNLRNIYLDYIRNTPELATTDYTIIADLDLIGNVYLDGITNTIGHLSANENAAGMCANGIYRWGGFNLYYDTYAFLEPDEEFDINYKYIHDLKKGLGVRYPRGHPPVYVSSCFGGFTIYKTKSLLSNNVKYDIQDTDNVLCEHVLLHNNIKSSSKQNAMYHNPSMINLVMLND